MPESIRDEIKRRLNLKEPGEYPSYADFQAAIVRGRDELSSSELRHLVTRMVATMLSPTGEANREPSVPFAGTDRKLIIIVTEDADSEEAKIKVVFEPPCEDNEASARIEIGVAVMKAIREISEGDFQITAGDRSWFAKGLQQSVPADANPAAPAASPEANKDA